MIRFLQIKNLAVIEELQLELEDGLTVLTGETGAGKSIIVGALGLLVGDRASSELIRTGESSATVEAIFEKADGAEILVRREINSSGRSRAFVDGTLVTTSHLRSLGTELLDLHGQHAHQQLLNATSHIDLLDEFSGLMGDRGELFTLFEKLRTCRLALDEASSETKDVGDRLEMLRFQLADIQKVDPGRGEADQLREKRKRLLNADSIYRLSIEAYESLYESEGSVIDSLADIWRKVEELSDLDDLFKNHLPSKESVQSQLEELAQALRTRSEEIDGVPEQLQEVEDRLATLDDLGRKYGQGDVDRVLDRQVELEDELKTLSNYSGRIKVLTIELEKVEQQYQKCAEELSKKRRAMAPKLTDRLESLMGELAMENARCQFRFVQKDGELPITERGIDQCELYLAPNEGEEPRPLARIASGGELSRVMLALKTAACSDEAGRTLVFDEVDAGIGGRVADVVGRRLKGLGERFQVLCVTHLPQIAVYGLGQIEIRKVVNEGRTLTTASVVRGSERVDAIAAMMGAGTPTAQSRRNAAELLKGAQLGGRRKNEC